MRKACNAFLGPRRAAQPFERDRRACVGQGTKHGMGAVLAPDSGLDSTRTKE